MLTKSINMSITPVITLKKYLNDISKKTIKSHCTEVTEKITR